jgi:hypothetical protein
MYTITLSDGTQLKNLELNGNNYIAETAIESSVFEGKTGTMKISDGKTTETYTGWELISNIVRDGKSWLVFGEKSAEEKRQETVNANFTDLQMALAEVYEMIIGA